MSVMVEETAFVKSSSLPLRARLTLLLFGIPEEVPGGAEDGDVLTPVGTEPRAEVLSA